MVDRSSHRSGLASVLRRLVVDPAFAIEVRTTPIPTLAEYDLSADELAALALWLDQPEPGDGFDALFDERSDDAAG
jgi:hypothetical protein